MKIIQDQVANHTGPYHPWVADPPTPTWFHGTAERHPTNTWQTWTLADPHATPESSARRSTAGSSTSCPTSTRTIRTSPRYLIQNALWWVGMTGLDGIRQDTLPYVPRRFWSEWIAALNREYPKLTLLGEMFDGDPALVSFFQGGAVASTASTAASTRCSTSRSFFPLRRAFAEGKPLRELAVDARPRPSLSGSFGRSSPSPACTMSGAS